MREAAPSAALTAALGRAGKDPCRRDAAGLGRPSGQVQPPLHTGHRPREEQERAGRTWDGAPQEHLSALGPTASNDQDPPSFTRLFSSKVIRKEVL